MLQFAANLLCGLLILLLCIVILTCTQACTRSKCSALERAWACTTAIKLERVGDRSLD
jgi:hypothetical protein